MEVLASMTFGGLVGWFLYWATTTSIEAYFFGED
jgi:hypothetical protein